ncbi:Porin subfamily protein [Rhizobiales bacterium GAS113]|nr:Porin subfamily protein [Rhizobiales bacterium GAS113]
MKLVKSLLLGSAAGLVAAAGAQAADLPTRKAAPVDYVRICAVHGPGFFYIPGSDTCIRLAGRARFEYVYTQSYNKTGDPSSFNATGRFSIDARTATEWGLLRAYTRVDFSRNSGNNYFGSGSGARGATKFGFGGGAGGVASGFPSFAGIDTAGNRLQTGVGISAAFVQWGGLTAGRIQSFFDFYADNDTWFGITDSDVVTQALAYTYTFGNGFSATLSIEDPKERQKYPIAGLAPVTGAGGINPAVPNANFSITYPFGLVSPYAAPGVLAPGGAINYIQRENVPDVVGVLNVTQGWGSAQLSGAYHRLETGGSTVANLTLNNTGTGFVTNPLVSTVSGGYGNVTGNAWAVQGGVKINLPMIAAGDYLYLQAAYSKGNLSYANSGNPGSWQGLAYGIGGTTFASYDAVVGPTGHLTLTPAYSVMASLEHYWTPTIRQGVFAGAYHVEYSSAIRTAAGYAMGAACPTCLGTITTATGAFYNPFNPNYNGGWQYNIGTNLIWSPVKDLDIGVEVMYLRNDMQHKEFDVNKGNSRLTKEDDVWVGRLRVQRDF